MMVMRHFADSLKPGLREVFLQPMNAVKVGLGNSDFSVQLIKEGFELPGVR